MRNTLPLHLLGSLLLTGCAATPVQSVLSCPPPPSVPQILTESVSTGPSLSERFEAHWKLFEQALADSLMKARRLD